jgi:hypothetical protein
MNLPYTGILSFRRGGEVVRSGETPARRSYVGGEGLTLPKAFTVSPSPYPSIGGDIYSTKIQEHYASYLRSKKYF